MQPKPSTRYADVRRAVTYRRYWLDACLTAVTPLMAGDVIDLGGKRARRRGTFRPPPTRSWRVVNMDPEVQPDIVADVCAVPLPDACADIVLCTETLEHVKNPDAALAEARRLLRPRGTLILSMPSVRPVSEHPEDYQWWTTAAFRLRLRDTDLTIWSMGGWIGTVSSFVEVMVRRWPPGLRRIGWEACRLLQWTDLRLRSAPTFTTGYFVIAVQKGDDPLHHRSQ